MNISRNLEAVRERIARAAVKTGRDPQEVKLIAVSKGRSAELVIKAAEAGQLAFGENRAQELNAKLAQVDRELEWHFIGHMQRNKVNMVVGKVALIHSLDSQRLAEAVDHRAMDLGITQRVLLQVNLSSEESKFGIEADEAYGLLETVLALHNLQVCGLMTMAPFLENKDEARPYFMHLRELRDELVRSNPEVDLGLLSMGMTQDFEIAVEEGANMVRIGTAIFAE